MTMKSTFEQLTTAEFKKRLSLGYKLMTYQLESGIDFAIPPMFRLPSKEYEMEALLNLVVPPMCQSISLEEYEKNEKEKAVKNAVKEIVKQILRHHKAFYNEQ